MNSDSQEENKDKKVFKPDLKGKDPNEISVLLGSQRTGVSFQRTRLSADRTLMSVIRTSLSLIGFGFTVFQFFFHITNGHIKKAPKNFGVALVLIGIITLIIGISYHIILMRQIREERELLMKEGLLPTIDKFPVSMTLIIAVLLFITGMVTIIAMIMQYIGY